VLTASPKRFFSFDHWSDNCIGTAPTCVVALDRQTRVHAVFVRQLATVNVVVGGPGRVISRPKGIACGAGQLSCSKDFPAGKSVRLVPVPASDGRFGTWAACDKADADGCRLFVGETPPVVMASFGHAVSADGPQTLTVGAAGNAHLTSDPPGIVCPY
jgi:hypothetical protein